MPRRKKSSVIKSNLMKNRRQNDSKLNSFPEIDVPAHHSGNVEQIMSPPVEFESCNIVLNFDILKNLVSKTCCSECQAPNLSLCLGKRYGLAHELSLSCSNCDFQFSTFSSNCISETSNSPFAINRRAVQAVTALGKGHAGLEVFSTFMNLNAMDSKTFSRHLKSVVSASKLTVQNHLRDIRKKVKNMHVIENNLPDSDAVMDITVSYDGSWHKRGHNSNYGIGCVIDLHTGYIIDYDILSKTCQSCSLSERCLGSNSAEFDIWYQGHKASCDANFIGSSGAMEMEIAKLIWTRSENYGFRYTTLLGDGDSKTFKALQDSEIYGSDVILKKEECINHVGKRMGTALRKLVETEKKRGITLGGKKHGSLKEGTINKITKYYRNAIVRNKSDINAMKTDIYAILYHCSSTDERPSHKKCPYTTDSWCFYNKALCEGRKPEPHKLKVKTPLRMDIVCKMLPVFQRLASDSLLERCSMAKTQNANESFHSLIWSRCSKRSNTSKQRVEAAVAQAILDFNSSVSGYLCNLQSNAQLPSTPSSRIQALRKDSRRYRKAAQKKSAAYKLYRRKVYLAKLKLDKKQNSKGVFYKSGGF